jgi:hypothetical protein
MPTARIVPAQLIVVHSWRARLYLSHLNELVFFFRRNMFMRQHTKELCLLMLRRFIVSRADLQALQWLLSNQHKVCKFLELHMDEMDTQERYRIYFFVDGVFPKAFSRLLKKRLTIETNPDCVWILARLADYHKMRLPPSFPVDLAKS